MVAARWRIRRMWTIETNLLNLEILTQQSSPSVSEGASEAPGIHLAMAFRTLADDSRSLALASRYEARLQRLYDRAYKTLRELQQARKSEPPAQPHTIEVRWVDSKEELDMRAAAAAAAKPAPEPELPNEPTEPRASASGPEPKRPNEPTTEPVTPNPPSAEPPFSPIQPKSDIF